MTDITQIPLNKLVASEDGAHRRGLLELAASVAAHGLLQSLVVSKHRKAKYAIVAGGRRLAALQLLAEQGSSDASFAVPCQVQDGDDATELSLVETALREQMHPSDEFEAFRNLVDYGTPVEDIAARFGVTPRVVEQRLAQVMAHEQQ